MTLPFSIGETAAKIAILTAQGKKPAATVVEASSLATVGGGWLTKANVAQFKAQWAS